MSYILMFMFLELFIVICWNCYFKFYSMSSTLQKYIYIIYLNKKMSGPHYINVREEKWHLLTANFRSITELNTYYNLAHLI